MSEKAEIGARIKEFATSKGWSKSFLANTVGIHQQNINRYLTGKSDPSRIIISLISCGLNPEWAKTGEGEMYTYKEDDREDETRKDQESNSPTVHQPVNAQLTPAQQTINGPQFNTKLDGIHYRAIVDTGRAMIAIGSKMLPDSSIQEGDQLFIETNITPQPSDYILRKTNDAPEIAKFTTGDPPPIGVVYKLIRSYRQTE